MILNEYMETKRAKKRLIKNIEKRKKDGRQKKKKLRKERRREKKRNLQLKEIMKIERATERKMDEIKRKNEYKNKH